MAIFAGLDVSDKTTHVCVVADDGAIQKRDVVASDPDALAKWLTALTFAASIEDPRRFARSEDVGAYAGLVPRRSQSGERDVRGNISKAGDPMLRRSLYEAANIMLCRVQRPFALQQRGQRIAESKGNKRARA